MWFKSRCRRRKLLPRYDFSVVWARSTAVAVPPGKRNGWEHQDLRRRHLLKSQIENVPRTPISAVARPLEEHSTLVWRLHQWFSRVFAGHYPWRASVTIWKPMRDSELRANVERTLMSDEHFNGMSG